MHALVTKTFRSIRRAPILLGTVCYHARDYSTRLRTAYSTSCYLAGTRVLPQGNGAQAQVSSIHVLLQPVCLAALTPGGS